MITRNTRLVLGCALAMALAACAPKEVTPGERTVQAMGLIKDGKPNELNAIVLAADVADVGIFYGLLSSVFAEDGGLSRTEVLSESIDGERAKVTVKLHYTNGKSDEETFTLQREDGAWKLDL